MKGMLLMLSLLWSGSLVFGQDAASIAAIDAAAADGRLINVLEQGASHSFFDYDGGNVLADFVAESDELMTTEGLRVALFYFDARYLSQTGTAPTVAAPVMIVTEGYDIIFVYAHGANGAEADLHVSHRVGTVHRDRLEATYGAQFEQSDEWGMSPVAKSAAGAAEALRSVDVVATTDLPRRGYPVLGFQPGAVFLPTAGGYSAALDYVSDLHDVLGTWNSTAVPLFTTDSKPDESIMNLVGTLPEDVRKLAAGKLSQVNGPFCFERWDLSGSARVTGKPVSGVGQEVADGFVGDMLVQRGMIEPLVEMTLVGENGFNARHTLERFAPVPIETDLTYEYSMTTLRSGDISLGVPVLKIFETSVVGEDLKFSISNNKYPALNFSGTANSLGLDVFLGLGYDFEIPSPISGGYYVNSDPSNTDVNTDGATMRSLIPPYRLNNTSMEAVKGVFSVGGNSDGTADDYSMGAMFMFDADSRQTLVWDCTGMNVMLAASPSLQGGGVTASGTFGRYRFDIESDIDMQALSAQMGIPDQPKERLVTSAVLAIPENNDNPAQASKVPGVATLMELLDALVGDLPLYGRRAKVRLSGFYSGEWPRSTDISSVTSTAGLSEAELKTFERFGHLESYEQQLYTLITSERWDATGDAKFVVQSDGHTNLDPTTVGSYLKRGRLESNGSAAALLIEVYLVQDQLYDMTAAR